MAKVTRVKFNSRKAQKSGVQFVVDSQGYMVQPKIVHSEQKREYIKSLYRTYLPNTHTRKLMGIE